MPRETSRFACPPDPPAPRQRSAWILAGGWRLVVAAGLIGSLAEPTVRLRASTARDRLPVDSGWHQLRAADSRPPLATYARPQPLRAGASPPVRAEAAQQPPVFRSGTR